MSTAVPDPYDDPSEQVVPASRGYWIASAIGWGLFGAAYAVMEWDTWGNRGDPVQPFRLNLPLSALGVVAIPSCLALAIACLYRFAFPYQLAIGAERLRVVRAGWSGPTILLQVPYANIADMRYEGFGLHGGARLPIKLIDRAHAGTYARGGFGVEIGGNGETVGDYCLKDCYQIDLEEIGRLIEKRRSPEAGSGGRGSAAAE
jgi:hypothetical protein